MTKEGFFYLGKVNKTHGLKGRVAVYFDVEAPLHYKDQKAIYMELNESLVPFFVSEISHKKGNVFTIQLQDVHTEDQASLLVGNQMFLPVDQKIPEDDSFTLSDLVGFLLIDQLGNEIGEIISIQGSDLNPLALVIINNTDIYIPLQEALLLGINLKENQVQVQIADGLVSLQK